jgi:hypothetical protein
MNCPECDSWVKGKTCRCGWTSAPKGHPLGYPQCEWESAGRCRYPGTLSSGSKFFCHAHFNCSDAALGASIVQKSLEYRHLPRDMRPINIEAARYCRQHGLETIGQMRAFCKARIPKIGKAA